MQVMATKDEEGETGDDEDEWIYKSNLGYILILK
jgi:hypothetical protein